MDEAVKKAQKKYNKVSVKAYTIKLNRTTDADIIDKIEKAENKQDYIRQSIRANLVPQEKENTVTVMRLKDMWKAEGTDIDLKEGSYDVLLHKIQEKAQKPYRIVTHDIVAR